MEVDGWVRLNNTKFITTLGKLDVLYLVNEQERLVYKYQEQMGG